MTRWAALLLLAPATAHASHEFLPAKTVSFEDVAAAWPQSDLDLNDVVLRYAARCDVGPGGIEQQEVHLSGVAAGAALTNALWLVPPGPTAELTMAVDGGSWVTLTPDGGGRFELFADFRDAFAGAPTGFVNTEPGAPVVDGRSVVLLLKYATPLAGSCPDLAFEVHRSGIDPITFATQVGPSLQPVAGAWPGDWQVPTEKTAIDDAYPDFLAGVLGTCAPGDSACEAWYDHPSTGLSVARVALDDTAPLPPFATCDDTLVWSGCPCDGLSGVMTQLQENGAPMGVADTNKDSGNTIILWDPDAGLYRMWRGTGNGSSGTSITARIWYYESADGVSWSTHVATNLSFSGTYTNVAPTSVWKEGSTFHMLYSKYYVSVSNSAPYGVCSGWGWTTLHATSTNGITWTGATTVMTNRSMVQLLVPASGPYLGYMQVSGDSYCPHAWVRRTTSDLVTWGGEQAVTLDGVALIASVGFPSGTIFAGTKVVPQFEISPDGTKIRMYAQEYDAAGVWDLLVVAESPIADGVHFTTTQVLSTDVRSGCTDGSWTFTRAVRVSPADDGVCYVMKGTASSIWLRNCTSL